MSTGADNGPTQAERFDGRPTTNALQDAVADKSLPPTPGVGGKSGAEQKKEIMERLQPQGKPIDAGKRGKKEHWERDPTTGMDVLVKDPSFEKFRAGGGDAAALDPNNPKRGPAEQKPRDPEKQDQRYPAPEIAQVGNICLQDFPPPLEKIDISHSKSILRQGAMVTTGLAVVAWYFIAFGHGVMGFVFRSSLIGAIAAVAWIASENAGRKVEKEYERIRMAMHQQRGEAHSPPTPESVEWLNAIFRLAWGLVNPEMFVPIIDMVEDVLQASLPGVIDAVRIADVGQGTNPLRIVSMRALADLPTHKEYPREEWVGLDKDTQSKLQEKDAAKGESNDPAKDVSGMADDDQTGDYLNYEISVSYQAQPGQSKKLRLHNMHLMLEFFVGLYDWFKVPIPIFAIVEGFVATARVRVQFIQSPPFVRNVTITLMGVPKVEVSVEPFTKKLPNILDLPLIKGFVEMGIAAACAQYIAPKSLTLNLAQLLAGDGVKKDTKALGVLVVTLHHAEDLQAQDRNTSDPYIVLAYAKFGKPLYSSRIIQGDLNPVWEETAFILVTDEEVKGEEDLSATLWDSDKRTADDLVGRITVPLTELMANPNKVTSRTDALQGFEDANKMPGNLHWSIGYFEKAALNQGLKKDPNANAPKEIKDKAEAQSSGTVADSKDEKDALRIPPDPEVPSGILSVIVHQINNLERQDIKGSTGEREGQAGQDTSEPAEEGDNLPSSYCEIIMNDDLVYKTRVKQYSSMPYFEAGTERFVRDWRTAVVRVQVRDARTREKDPVLGIVTVKLADIFKNSSEVTRLFSLQEGIGYGRANISFLFRSVKTDLPRNMLGWDTGTVEVVGDVSIEAVGDHDFKTKKLSFSTTEHEYKAPSKVARVEGSGRITWDLPEDVVRLPVYNRYASALLFEIGSGGPGFIGQDSDYIAMVWLQDVLDNEETSVRVPVIKSSKLEIVRQNYINDQTAKTHKYDVVGYLTCKVIIDSGLDGDHSDKQKSREEKHRYEAYDRVDGQAQLAEKNAHAFDDGKIDKKEAKALEAEKKHQLGMRHRGVMQFQPVRTAAWSKQGIKDRASRLKAKITGDNTREPTVESEA